MNLQELLCAVRRRPQSGLCRGPGCSRDQADSVSPLDQAELKKNALKGEPDISRARTRLTGILHEVHSMPYQSMGFGGCSPGSPIEMRAKTFYHLNLNLRQNF